MQPIHLSQLHQHIAGYITNQSMKHLTVYHFHIKHGSILSLKGEGLPHTCAPNNSAYMLKPQAILCLSAILFFRA